MLLILASRVDEGAERLAAAMPSGSAALVTPADLSESGWQVDSAALEGAVFVAGGRLVEARTITGVVCLLPYVFDRELVQIEPESRPYVAAEVTAFLRYWLTVLDCPKLNPPSASCLSGPGWRLERWHMAAVAAGLPTRPLVRRTSGQGGSPKLGNGHGVTVTVVGETCVGSCDAALTAQARALADMAEVDLLSVHFVPAYDRTDDQPSTQTPTKTRRTPCDAQDRYVFAGADCFPDLGSDEMIAAVRGHFLGNRSDDRIVGIA